MLLKHFLHLVLEGFFRSISPGKLDNKIRIVPVMEHHFLLFRQVRRYAYLKGNYLVALYLLVPQAGNTAVFKGYDRIGLGSGLDRVFFLAVYSIYGNFL